LRLKNRIDYNGVTESGT